MREASHESSSMSAYVMSATPSSTSSNDFIKPPQPELSHQQPQSEQRPQQQQMPTIVMNVQPNSLASASIYNMQTGQVYQVQHEGSSWPSGIVAVAPPPGQSCAVSVTSKDPTYSAVATVMPPEAPASNKPDNNLEQEAELALEQYNLLKKRTGTVPDEPLSQKNLEKEAEQALKEYRQQKNNSNASSIPSQPTPPSEHVLHQHNLELLQQAFNSAYAVKSSSPGVSDNTSQSSSAPVKQEGTTTAPPQVIPNNKRLFLDNKVAPIEQEVPSREEPFHHSELFKDEEAAMWKELKEIAGVEDCGFPSGNVSEIEQDGFISETSSISGLPPYQYLKAVAPSPGPLQSIKEGSTTPPPPLPAVQSSMYQPHQMQQLSAAVAPAVAPPQSTVATPVSFLPQQQQAVMPQATMYQMPVTQQRAMPPAPTFPAVPQATAVPVAQQTSSAPTTTGQQDFQRPPTAPRQEQVNSQPVSSQPVATTVQQMIGSPIVLSTGQVLPSPAPASMGQSAMGSPVLISMGQPGVPVQVIPPAAPSANPPSAAMDYQVVPSPPMVPVVQAPSPAFTAMSQPAPSPAMMPVAQPTYASPAVTSMGQPTVAAAASPRKMTNKATPARAACGAAAKHKKVHVFGGKAEQLSSKHSDSSGEVSPNTVLTRILQERGYHTYQMPGLKSGYNTKPTPLQLASFGTQVVQAVHKSDVNHLKAVLEFGLSPNPCNSFGDSLLDIVCKRSNFPIFKCLVDHGCNLRVCDGFGRTPLHNAAWSGTFCEPLVDLILRNDPLQVLIQDKHGKTPMEYIRKQFWGVWIDFLMRNKDKYWPIGGAFQAPPGADDQRADPVDSISLDLAKNIASGGISLEEVRAMDAQTRTSYKSDSHPKPQGIFKF